MKVLKHCMQAKKKILNDTDLKKLHDNEHKRIIESAKSYGISIKNSGHQPYQVYQPPMYSMPIDPIMYQNMYSKPPGFYMQPNMMAPNMMGQGMMPPNQMSFTQNYLGDQGNNFANNKNEDPADLFNKS